LCICAPTVWADPIEVTSGQMHVAWDDASSFALFGAEDFALTGLFVRVESSPQRACFSGCAPGTIVDLRGVVGGGAGFTLGQSLTAHVNGVVYARQDQHESWLNLVGTLVFDAPTAVVPPMDGQTSGRIAVGAPFVFEGRVAGFARGDEHASEPIFDIVLRGQGIAELELTRSAEGVYRFPEATYTFTAPDPIPEPATLMLFGSGVAMLHLRRTRRTRVRR
jgi:hypothetical protein